MLPPRVVLSALPVLRRNAPDAVPLSNSALLAVVAVVAVVAVFAKFETAEEPETALLPLTGAYGTLVPVAKPVLLISSS